MGREQKRKSPSPHQGHPFPLGGCPGTPTSHPVLGSEAILANPREPWPIIPLKRKAMRAFSSLILFPNRENERDTSSTLMCKCGGWSPEAVRTRQRACKHQSQSSILTKAKAMHESCLSTKAVFQLLLIVFRHMQLARRSRTGTLCLRRHRSPT